MKIITYKNSSINKFSAVNVDDNCYLLTNGYTGAYDRSKIKRCNSTRELITFIKIHYKIKRVIRVYSNLATCFNYIFVIRSKL